MDVSKWKRRRFVPTWGENDQEDVPCVVIFHPPTVGWMTRWREVTLSAPRIEPDEDDPASQASKIREWSDAVAGFRLDFMEDLVIAIEGLTNDDRALSLEESLAFLRDNEGLREEVFFAILTEGSVTAGQGKD